MQYTPEDLDSHALVDLLNDASSAHAQSLAGPFYPELGITAESLTAYVEKCRRLATKYANGGAHRAILRGEGLFD